MIGGQFGDFWFNYLEKLVRFAVQNAFLNLQTSVGYLKGPSLLKSLNQNLAKLSWSLGIQSPDPGNSISEGSNPDRLVAYLLAFDSPFVYYL